MRSLSIPLFLAFLTFAIPHYSAAAVSSGTTDNTSNGTVQNYGQTDNTIPRDSVSVPLVNPLKADNLESFLLDILEFVIRIGSIVVILMLVFVGYKFVEAQGAPDKIEGARRMLLWTVVGALILLGSKAIALSIKATASALSAGG